MSKTNRTLGMNPETHFREIYRTLSTYEFPWDINQALSFALFRTYAVPSVGKLLYDTGQFTEDTQKRYDDTSLLLEVPLLRGFDSEEGKSAIRRINQMHRMYDITNDDFLYVLSTFVVVPQRWIRDYGWRQLTDDELLASVRYYQTLGRHMGIKNIPETFEEFETLMDGYEEKHFAYDAGARAVADATMDLLASFYPRPAKRVVNLFSRTLMDEPLLDAFRYKHPHQLARKASLAAMKARAFAVSKMPARRKPKHVYEMSRIRSYPNGFDIRTMGTFAPGCPVDHSSPTADTVG